MRSLCFPAVCPHLRKRRIFPSALSWLGVVARLVTRSTLTQGAKAREACPWTPSKVTRLPSAKGAGYLEVEFQTNPLPQSLHGQEPGCHREPWGCCFLLLLLGGTQMARTENQRELVPLLWLCWGGPGSCLYHKNSCSRSQEMISCSPACISYSPEIPPFLHICCY